MPQIGVAMITTSKKLMIMFIMLLAATKLMHCMIVHTLEVNAHQVHELEDIHEEIEYDATDKRRKV